MGNNSQTKPKPTPVLIPQKPNGDIITRALNTNIKDLTVGEFEKTLKERLTTTHSQKIKNKETQSSS